MTLALLSLFLAAFSIGTTEFVVAGLLPEISRDLGVSIPTAGLLVSGYALGVAVGGPILSLLTSRFPRKTMVLVLMAVFVGGHVLCALAPSYELLMAARIVVSMSHGTFFGLAAIIAVSIVPEERRGRAVSLVFAGITVANIVGVPLGTAIGNAFGWRATFWVVAGVAVLAALAMALALPRGVAGAQKRATIAAQFRVLGSHKVWLSYAIIVCMMIGTFSFFTFIAPFLTEVSSVPREIVSGLLLLFGLGATLGIFVGGRLADWRPAETMVLGFVLQILVFGAVLAFSSNPVVMGGLLFCVGGSGFLVGAALQNRILRGAAHAPDLASTLISSVFNIGIAGGAYIGATALGNGAGYAQLPWFGFGLAFVTSGLAIVAFLLDRRPARVLAAA